MIVLELNLSHQCHTVLEADLVRFSHFSGGGIAHTVKYLVEYINLLLAQRLFKRDTELVKLVRELRSVNIACTKGVNHSVNGEIIELNEGDMIFVNSAQLHYGFWEKKEPCEFLCVLFGIELLSAVPDSVISKLIGNNSPSYIIFRSSDIEDKTVIDRLTKLNTICEQQKDGYELSAVTLCYETASSLFERCTGTVKELHENSRRLSELHAMIGFIQGHYTEKLSLEDISASGQVCRSKCFELFKEFVGKTPVDYLNEYRISKSLDLLKTSDMNVTEIAEAVLRENLKKQGK